MDNKFEKQKDRCIFLLISLGFKASEVFILFSVLHIHIG